MAVFYGNMTGSGGSKYSLWAEITQNSRNISQNSSNISTRVYFKRSDGYNASAYNLYLNSNSLTISLSGVQRYSDTLTYDTRNGATALLGEWTGDIAHAADGSLSLAVAVNFTTSNSNLVSGSITGTFTATPIPRASTLTLSVQSLNPTQDVTATVTSASPGFSHRITYAIGTYSQVQTLPAGTLSKLFTVPQSWANAVYNSRSSRITVTLDTYSGSNKVGSNYYYLVLAIPQTSSYMPVFDITLSRTDNSVPTAWGVYVKGKSGLTVNITNDSYKYSAYFSSVRVTVGGVTKTTLPAVFSELNKSGAVQISVTVTDSRGISKTNTQSITVENYAKPTAIITGLTRCNSQGAESNTGTYISLTPTYSFSSVAGKNSVTASLSYKETGSPAVGTTVSFTSGIGVVAGGGLIDEAKSYEVTLTVSDALSESVTTVRYMGTASVPLNIRSGGKGVGFGKYCDADYALQSEWRIYEQGARVVEHGISGSSYWVKFSDGTMLEGGKKTVTGTSLSLNSTFSDGVKYASTSITPVQSFATVYVNTCSVNEAQGAVSCKASVLPSGTGAGKLFVDFWSASPSATALGYLTLNYLLIGTWI